MLVPCVEKRAESVRAPLAKGEKKNVATRPLAGAEAGLLEVGRATTTVGAMRPMTDDGVREYSGGQQVDGRRRRSGLVLEGKR